MMNEILRDLINEGKVAAFVDDVLVGTEMEEGHDEIVEEILRKITYMSNQKNACGR